jgi:DNA-binding transcriptional MerR regulator
MAMTERFDSDLFPWESEPPPAGSQPAPGRAAEEVKEAGATAADAGQPAEPASAGTEVAARQAGEHRPGEAYPADPEAGEPRLGEASPADPEAGEPRLGEASPAGAETGEPRAGEPLLAESDTGEPWAAGAAPRARDEGGTAGAAEARGHDDRDAAPDDRDGSRDTAAAARPVVRKEYYSISEVSDLVGLPAHVLRYWESQFSVLNPSKNRSGNRVYQRKEIKLILLVKQLLHEEKYTVEGAKQKLDQLRRGGDIREATRRALDEQMVRVLREDLLALSELLKVEEGE